MRRREKELEETIYEREGMLHYRIINQYSTRDNCVHMTNHGADSE